MNPVCLGNLQGTFGFNKESLCLRSINMPQSKKIGINFKVFICVNLYNLFRLPVESIVCFTFNKVMKDDNFLLICWLVM